MCIVGELDLSTVCGRGGQVLYKSSTLRSLNVEELQAGATPHTSAYNTYVIDIDLAQAKGFPRIDWEMDASTLHKDRNHQFLDVRPSKFVIHERGGHVDAHRDTVRGEEHIGTLVLILNSEYTGGELEVTHGDRTEVVTGPYSWVAMYGDCLHKINPVTSGTRVSLIHDIYIRQKDCYRGSPPLDVWDLAHKSIIPPTTMLRGADTARQEKIIEGMHEQLRGFDSAVICLQHLYPACQANPDFLKGGDQLLYDILRDHFALAVLPCTIYRKKYDGDAMFYDACVNDFCVKPWCVPALEGKHTIFVQAAATLRTNFIIFDRLTKEHVLQQVDLKASTGKKQGEEILYIVSGLQVRIKSV